MWIFRKFTSVSATASCINCKYDFLSFSFGVDADRTQVTVRKSRSAVDPTLGCVPSDQWMQFPKNKQKRYQALALNDQDKLRWLHNSPNVLYIAARIIWMQSACVYGCVFQCPLHIDYLQFARGIRVPKLLSFTSIIVEQRFFLHNLDRLQNVHWHTMVCSRTRVVVHKNVSLHD